MIIVPPTPLSPEQAKALQHQSIPPFVFEVLNHRIAEGLRYGRVQITVPSFVEGIVQKAAESPDFAHFKAAADVPDHWYTAENIKRTYEPAGWTVDYFRPAYDESGESSFTFTEKR